MTKSKCGERGCTIPLGFYRVFALLDNTTWEFGGAATFPLLLQALARPSSHNF